MGNTKSQYFEQVSVDPWWSNNKHTSEEKPIIKKTLSAQRQSEIQTEISDIQQRRLTIIAAKKQEMDDLRQQLREKTEENEELKRLLKVQSGELEIKVDATEQSKSLEIPGCSKENQNEELNGKIAKIQLELESAKMEIQTFQNERKEYNTHVAALKDIITVSKELLLLRESQIKELGQKIDEIQASLMERELTAFSDELRQEYEKQLKNMKQLRLLYDERQRMDKAERNTLKNDLEDAKRSLDYRETRNSELQARIEELEKDNSDKYDTIRTLESQLGLSKAESRDFKTELSVINQLFSQILVGFNNGQDVDLDKLIKLLEENHSLLTDIFVNEDCHEVSSALPKVLLDLVNQVNDTSQQATSAAEADESPPVNQSTPNTLSTPSEIVENLPKVWRVLTELLSHQSTPISVLDSESQNDNNPCYKSVQTPTGPTLVLSVSKTFIRLKDLIVEKKSLEKETLKLKQLNTHLETRLQDQEKRLGLVSVELSKTWNVVGKMQKQHQQLHTQEKILRYELAQKRKLLNELKEELEYCREKWLQAREKNSHTEEQWKQLRNEFIARKSVASEELNNSGESGYSDDRESSSSDEDDAHAKLEVEKSNLVKMDSISELSEPDSVQPIYEVIHEEIENIESEVQSCDDEIVTDLSLHSEQNESLFNLDLLQEVSSTHDHKESLSVDILPSSSTGLPQESHQSCDDEIIKDLSLHCEQEDTLLNLDLSQEVPSTHDHEDSLSIDILPSFSTTSPQESHQSCDDETVTDLSLHCEQEESLLNLDISQKVPSVHDHEESLSVDILPSSSSTTLHQENLLSSIQQKTKAQEKMLLAKDKRLKQLEEEGKSLIAQATKTSNRSIEICSKLDTLHGQYGNEAEKIRRQNIDDMYKKLEEDILQTIIKTQNGDLLMKPNELVDDLHQAGTSSARTQAEMFAKRDERLQRMEEQAQQLVKRVQNNSVKSTEICSKLSLLHDRCVESKNSQLSTSDDIGEESGAVDEQDDATNL